MAETAATENALIEGAPTTEPGDELSLRYRQLSVYSTGRSFTDYTGFPKTDNNLHLMIL